MKEEKIKKQSWTKGSSFWGILIFSLLLIVDQITKAMADAFQWDFSIIEGWLGMKITYNTGISYGLGSGASKGVKLAVVAVTLAVMAVLAVFYFVADKRRKWLRTALVFVVAGGVGNAIDRIVFRVWEGGAKGVRDMVDLSRFGFAVCNFADFFITAGAILLILAFLFFDKDAAFPAGKYKLLAEEAEEKAEKKKIEKAQKKNG